VPPIEPNAALTLEALIGMGAAENIEAIEEISMHASKQFGLEKQLNAMKADWVSIREALSATFSFSPHVLRIHFSPPLLSLPWCSGAAVRGREGLPGLGYPDHRRAG
jgi:hypothetical protein